MTLDELIVASSKYLLQESPSWGFEPKMLLIFMVLLSLVLLTTMITETVRLEENMKKIKDSDQSNDKEKNDLNVNLATVFLLSVATGYVVLVTYRLSVLI